MTSFLIYLFHISLRDFKIRFLLSVLLQKNKINVCVMCMCVYIYTHTHTYNMNRQYFYDTI